MREVLSNFDIQYGKCGRRWAGALVSAAPQEAAKRVAYFSSFLTGFSVVFPSLKTIS